MVTTGTKVVKKSKKPFKSSLKVNTVKDITLNPHTQNPAFSFVEDDSIVDIRTVRDATPEEVASSAQQVIGLSDSLEESYRLYDGLHALCEPRIRLHAYHKWVAAGKPTNMHEHFWLEAERAVLGYTREEARRSIAQHHADLTDT